MTTRFKRITESPEVLAEFINKITDVCGILNSCSGCPIYDACSLECTASLVDWFNEEEEADG